MSMAIKGKRRTIKSLDEVMDFGMYKNDTIEEVIRKNFSYIVWMHKETNNKIGKRLIKKIEELDDKYKGKLK